MRRVIQILIFTLSSLQRSRCFSSSKKPFFPGFLSFLRFSLAGSSVRYSLNKNKYLLPPEVERLKKIITDYQETDTRNCLLINLGLRTGARAQELLNLTMGDLNAYDETVYIRGLKNSNDREIPLHSDFFKRLHRFAATQDGRKLFGISYDRLYQVWQHYRPVPKKFHSLRHTFAIELYQKTKDLRLVQVALGHRNITNTMIYADYVYSQQELRKLIL
jgi:integrase